MGIFGKAACFVGMHDWGGWIYKAERHCTQIQKCTRCGEPNAATQTVHELGDWHYTEERNCLYVRICTRCGDTESKTKHDWPPWTYVTQVKCLQERKCKRCEELASRTSHEDWTEWKFKALDLCNRARRCTRCQSPEEDIEHTWGVWNYGGPKTCVQVRFCQRCHHREELPLFRHEDHEAWSDWDYQVDYNCSRFERHCLRCNQTEKETRLVPIHQWTDWEHESPTRAGRKCVRCGMSDSKLL